VAARLGTAAELPTQRATRATPVRAAHWLVALHGRRVLLERRPAAGLWGGMMAPPQFDDQRSMLSYLARIGWDAVAIALPARRHAFTHFTLMYTPHVVRVARATSLAAESAAHWLPLAEIDDAPLPTPVHILLGELRDGRIAAVD
jgi:A/G-specific adenine glycosylase